MTTHSNIELSIVLPCYNSKKLIEASLLRIHKSLKKIHAPWECVLVDDGSSDGTDKLLDKLKKSKKWLKVVKCKKNKGKGAAILEGFRIAAGKWIVINDIDLQYKVGDMISCYNLLLETKSDLVVGSRVSLESLYHIRAKDIRYIFTRHIISRGLNFFLRTFFLPGIFDTQCGLKGFSRKFIESVLKINPSIHGFAFDIELLLIARENNFKTLEMPVQFYYSDYPSTVTFIRAGRKLLQELMCITINKWQKKYILK